MDALSPLPPVKTPKEPFRKRRPVLFWLGACLVLGVALSTLWTWLAEDEDNVLGRE
jgi:hypothetical protein